VLLVVQVPCLNEEDNIGAVIADVPRQISGVDEVKVLVIDDGSEDATASVATEAGADRVVRHSANQGLAAAYSTGLKTALDMGADVIVNTDADNQYPGDLIPQLVAPVVNGQADLVIGARPIGEIREFSRVKRLLQRIGSKVVRWITRLNVDDAPSGFRAINRQTAQQVFVYTRYTYTLETLVQLGVHGVRVVSLPIRVNASTRPSRLMKNSLSYVLRSTVTILRVLLIYRAVRIFGFLSLLSFVTAALLGVRYLILLSQDPRAGHVQSLILAAILAIASLLFLLAGFLGDLLAANRRLLEDIRYRLQSGAMDSFVLTRSREEAESGPDQGRQ